MTKMKKVVVKVGTSTLTQGSKKISRRFMLELSRQVADVHEKGSEVILVTSGAVAAGRELLEQQNGNSSPSKQMFSAIGQVQLMQVWRELFSLYDKRVGQLLLTREDFSHQERIQNVQSTIGALLEHNIIPIINENDPVAIRESRVGDNDNLAAFVAHIVGADILILLTDQEGLYTEDPRLNPDAQLISLINEVDTRIKSLAGGSSTTLGTGGMSTKIEAAEKAMQYGISTVIASSSHPNILIELANGKQIGTRFVRHEEVSV